jgi:hypothetical protein
MVELIFLTTFKQLQFRVLSYLTRKSVEMFLWRWMKDERQLVFLSYFLDLRITRTSSSRSSLHFSKSWLFLESVCKTTWLYPFTWVGFVITTDGFQKPLGSFIAVWVLVRDNNGMPIPCELSMDSHKGVVMTKVLGVLNRPLITHVMHNQMTS